MRKLKLIILLLGVLMVTGTGLHAQKVTKSFQAENLKSVLKEIEKQTGLSIMYQTDEVNENKLITASFADATIEMVLQRVLDSNLTFSIDNKMIVIHKRGNERDVGVRADGVKSMEVKGLITDRRREPLIGVTVKLRGTAEGVVTNLDGEFTLKNIPENALLEVSYVGMQAQTISVAGNSRLEIVMLDASEQLQEVIVTAMGIERKSESLTYATQQISNRELTRAKDVNFVNSLQGKSAGLTITPNASGAGGGSSRIVLRGQSSIMGNNQPLIVLDGIPMSNGMSSQTSDLLTGTARDGGDLLSTINPDDIANISILKGPNAAALYGSAANNGVIIITTKSGRDGKVRVDVSSNLTLETPLVYPRQQTEFGMPINGTAIDYNAWGERIADMTDDQLAMFPYLTSNPRNNVTDFFNTGQTYNNSIAISGGTEFVNTYFSYGNTIQKGLIDKNTFERHNFLVKESFSLFDRRLKLDFSLNYVNQTTNNRPVIGKAKGVLPGLYRTPAAVDLRYFDKNRTVIADENHNLVTMTGGNRNLVGEPVQNFPWLANDSWMNNPYFMLDAVRDQAIRERVMVTATARYDIVQGLNAQARFSFDKSNDQGTITEQASIKRDKDQTIGGSYWGSRNSMKEIYSDYLLTHDNEIDGISFSATVGTSFKRINHRSLYMYKHNDSTFVKPNVAWPIEGANQSQNQLIRGLLGGADSNNQKNWEAAVFATGQVGFFGKGYIDFSIRNDWAKAFQQFATPGNYKSFPYYSVGGNVLLKEVIPLEMRKVDALKLRASYSVVGNSVPNRLYAARYFNPLTGEVGARMAAFDNPRPETTESVELGLDGVLFDNKLDFDITMYQAVMENQFMEISTSTGVRKPVNSGKVRNRGVELSSNYNWRFNRNFRWVTGLTFSFNDNKILETYTALDGTKVEIFVGPQSLGIQSKYLVGGSYGDMYGRSFRYNREGTQIDVNADGKPQINPTYDRFLGNTTARVNFGWNNTFVYKDLALYVLLDGKIGGKVISLTEAEYDQYGLSQRSADARNTNNGMVTLPDGQQVTARNYYEATGENQYNCVFDATNVRLREMSLGYTFTNVFGVSKNLTLSAIARNLGFLYKTSPIDPDISVSAANGVGGIESFSLPTTRSFGFNIKVTF
jgi:TonB-linked SusC/RagA family outer membrane protein